jgi:hypothetical protein
LVRSASEEALPAAKRKSAGRRHLLNHDKSECPTCHNSDAEDEVASTSSGVIFPLQPDNLVSGVEKRSPSVFGSYSRLSEQSHGSSRDIVSASTAEDAALLQPYPEYKH